MMTFNPKYFPLSGCAACAALLAAAASSAVCAASVSIGGMYDTGLKYTLKVVEYTPHSISPRLNS